MNKLTEIKGICPIVAAPFTDNGEVDYESLDKLVKHLIREVLSLYHQIMP